MLGHIFGGGGSTNSSSIIPIAIKIEKITNIISPESSASLAPSADERSKNNDISQSMLRRYTPGVVALVGA
jgi:hypothetical protein